MEEIKPLAYIVRLNTINCLDVFVRKNLKDLVMECLKDVRKDFHVAIRGYLLMSDHISVVVSMEEDREFKVFYENLKKTISRRVMDMLEGERFSDKRWLLFLINFINKENSEGGENRIWNIDNPIKPFYSELDMEDAIKTMYQEPVWEGIVTKPEDYNYSSLKENMVENQIFEREAV